MFAVRCLRQVRSVEPTSQAAHDWSGVTVQSVVLSHSFHQSTDSETCSQWNHLLVKVTAGDRSPARDRDVVHIANKRRRGFRKVVKGVCAQSRYVSAKCTKWRRPRRVGSVCLTADVGLYRQCSTCACAGRWLSIGACPGGVRRCGAELDVCRSPGKDSGAGQASECRQSKRSGKLHI